MLFKTSDNDIKRDAASAIWKQRNLPVIEEMCRRLPDNIALKGVGFGLEIISDKTNFNRLLAVAFTNELNFLAVRAIGLQKSTEHVNILQQNLVSTDPINRGCAALSLARIGGHEAVLKRAYDEAHEPDERVFIALALLHAKVSTYDLLENQLRSDLVIHSARFWGELQADILT